MSRHVITITPDTGSEAGSASAHSTMRVDVSYGQTRVTELTIRSASGDGLTPADLPPIDLDLLVRALTAPQAAPTTQPVEPAAAAPALEPATTRRRPRKASQRRAVRAPTGGRGRLRPGGLRRAVGSRRSTPPTAGVRQPGS